MTNKHILNNLNEAIRKFKISQAYVSNDLKQFEDRFFRIFKSLKNLKITNNNKKNTLFFGLYNLNDLKYINNQNSYVFILFGGSDIDLNLYTNIVKKSINHKIFLSISDDIYKRINHLDEVFHIKNFSLLEPQYFKPIKKYGCNIYIYDGYNYKRNIYNIELINIIKERLPYFNYIHSSEIDYSY